MTPETRADGQEVLVVDRDEKIRNGLESLLGALGLVPTVVADADYAAALSREKFFAVALIDLDTPGPEGGIDLVAKIHATSPATEVLMMTGNRTFEAAVRSFRAGAADVVVKAPDQVPYLKERVVTAATRQRKSAASSRLLDELSEFHDALIKVVITSHCKAAELEERQAGTYPPSEEEMRILIVDHDTWLYDRLLELMRSKSGFRISSAATGGEALDIVGQERFHIALVRQTLTDLPGSMVVGGIKGQTPDTITVLFTHPKDGRAGTMTVSEGSKLIPFIPSFSAPEQLLDRFDELRNAYITTSRERRYLADFRVQHFELLRRYAELKQKIERTREE